MKRIFSGAIVAVVSSGLAGCGMNGGDYTTEYTYTIEVPTSIDETEGGVTTTTEYEWNTDGSVKAQKQTRGDQPVYQDANYTYSPGQMTYYRTYYQEGLVSRVLRVEEKYLYADWTGRYSTKFYSEDSGTDYLVEREENLYANQMQVGYKHEKEGVMLLERSGYEYDYNSVSYIESGSTIDGLQKVTISYISMDYGLVNEIITTQADNPTVVISRKKYSYSVNGIAQGYKVYKGNTEQIIEEQIDYKSESNKLSYTTVWYDDSGQPTRQLKTVQNKTTLTIKISY
jgi:hypothetical protein